MAKIKHIALTTHELEKVASFYKDVFDMEEVGRSGTTYVYLSDGDMNLTIRAVTNARQLAKPGVDCLTWGPADLSFDLEAHPEHPFRTVDDCLRHVLKQLEGTGVRNSFRSYS